MKIRPAVRPGRRIEKKVRTGQDRTGQDRTGQSKSHKVVTFRLGYVPTESKICMEGNLPDIMMCAKFQDAIFRGYDFTGGRISHFPIDFCMGLIQCV